MNYRYSYEKLDVGGNGWSPIGGFGMSTEKYREIIDCRAAEGWRFVAMVPLETRANGMVESYDLIFERPEGAE